jgi:hypothetical protein
MLTILNLNKIIKDNKIINSENDELSWALKENEFLKNKNNQIEDI